MADRPDGGIHKMQPIVLKKRSRMLRKNMTIAEKKIVNSFTKQEIGCYSIQKASDFRE